MSEGGGNVAVDFERLLQELNPGEIKGIVEASFRASRLRALDDILKEWITDVWKSCGKWPFSYPLGKCVGKLVGGNNAFRIADFLRQDLPLKHYELIELVKLFGSLSADKRREFFRCFRHLVLKSGKGRKRVRSLDLYPAFFRLSNSPGFLKWKPARWRRTVSGVVKPLAGRNFEKEFILCRHFPCSVDYWGGYGNLSFKWLDKLISCQADELRFIRSFCREVSKKSRKVLLSWHNATLGAVGGWAFSGPVREIVSNSGDPARLICLLNEAGNCREYRKSLARSWKLFESRIVIPALRFYLWLESQCWKMGGGRRACIQMLLERFCRKFPDWERLRAEIPFDDLSFPPVSGSLLRGLRFLSWCEGQRRLWEKGWSMCDVLIEQGHKLLRAGRIDSVVLPRIDKFFMSTRRTADVEYLTVLVKRLIQRHKNKIIILFWDDTVHSSHPSLYLAIKKLVDSGIPVCGLGIFSNGQAGSDPDPDYVVERTKDCTLFILRPYERPYGGGFTELFLKRDYSFFNNYSPTWRDGLSFIYSGTAVENFVSLPCLAEGHTFWVLSGGRRVPFGVWFRAVLRARLGIPDSLLREYEGTAGLEALYARWANLI
ncbi:hypothetical protein [Thermodesulforhabdus norvegica]|uniref:Uncharacterized protein n=1 Tax=Thermodesulforhabdus norvegica TaxID=39841 RepID=A0A1I4SWL4_9BACT|nr:hypothetical protein [Thermodesulforhabdus norvegica]SFM68749.1 hypothetical protein SAMN05660836_01201 [Thermodesulforhabdus norvegica]